MALRIFWASALANAAICVTAAMRASGSSPAKGLSKAGSTAACAACMQSQLVSKAAAMILGRILMVLFGGTTLRNGGGLDFADHHRFVQVMVALVHFQGIAGRCLEGLAGHGGDDLVSISGVRLFNGLLPHVDTDVSCFHRIVGHDGVSVR